MRSYSPDDADPPRDDLHWLAVRLFQDLGRRELPVVAAHGLSLWGFEVLGRLIRRPADSQAELGAALGLDKSKIVRVLDELERHGHARRTSGPDDRRRRVLTATDHGRAAWESARDRLDEIERELFLCLPARERDVVRRGLKRLVDALDQPTT